MKNIIAIQLGNILLKSSTEITLDETHDSVHVITGLKFKKYAKFSSTTTKSYIAFTIPQDILQYSTHRNLIRQEAVIFATQLQGTVKQVSGFSLHRVISVNGQSELRFSKATHNTFNSDFNLQIGEKCALKMGSIRCGFDLQSHRINGKVTGVLSPSAITSDIEGSRLNAAIQYSLVHKKEAYDVNYFSDDAVYLKEAFSSDPRVDDDVYLQPRCGQKKAQCKTLKNIDNFLGM